MAQNSDLKIFYCARPLEACSAAQHSYKPKVKICVLEIVFFNLH